MVVFLAVVRDGSFGRAATSLLISQPAVSERIAGLERTVGTDLFARGNRGATLTPAGERLLPYAQRTVGLLEQAVQAVRSPDHPLRLRVAVHTTFAHRAIPMILEALEDHPRVVKFRDAHSDEIVTMLLDGVADVGFVLPGTRPRGLRFVPLPADPVICVCAPTHALATSTTVSRSLLGEHYLALNAWGTDAAKFIEELDRSGFPEWRRRECSDASTAIRLARHHGHVALVAESAADDDLAAGTLVRLDLRPAPRWTVPLAIAHRERDGDDPVVQALEKAARRSTSTRRQVVPT